MTPSSTNPANLYRWEDSSSLEHSCWACPTKANSPKALHTCYGIHSVPCRAYHSTMHAIGGSHKCSACTMSSEMHDNRHREIAELVAEYRRNLEPVTPSTTRSGYRSVLSERHVNISRGVLHQNNTVIKNDHNDQDAKDAEETHDQNVENCDSDGNDQENRSIADTSSAADTSAVAHLNHSKLSKAEKRTFKRSRKAQKSLVKASKNQSKHEVGVTSQDVAHIATILHGGCDEDVPGIDRGPSTHPLATDVAIEDVIARNLGYVKQIHGHKKALHDSVRAGRRELSHRKKAKTRVSEGALDFDLEAVIDAILLNLGIGLSKSSLIAPPRLSLPVEYVQQSTFEAKTRPATSKLKTKNRTKPKIAICNKIQIDHSSSSCSMDGATVVQSGTKAAKSQAALLHILREKIKEDLEKYENDLRQRYIRAGGFFRYAGRAVFERMTRIAERLDVGTGDKIPAVDDVKEGSTINDDDKDQTPQQPNHQQHRHLEHLQSQSRAQITPEIAEEEESEQEQSYPNHHFVVLNRNKGEVLKDKETGHHSVIESSQRT